MSGLRQHVNSLGEVKQAWTNRRHAADVARHMQSEGRHVDVYRCAVCGEWHVGRPNTGKDTR